MNQKYLNTPSSLQVLSKKLSNSINIFWYGYLIYILFFVFATAESPILKPALCQAGELFGLLLIVYGAATSMRFKFDNKYLEITFILFIVYSISIPARAENFDSNSLKLLLLNANFGLLAYIAPLVLLLPRNFYTYKKLFNVLLILGIFYILYVIMFYDILHDPDRINLVALGLVENFTSYLALPICFILMTFVFQIGKKGILGIGKANILAAMVMMLALFFSVYRARRGLIFMSGTLLAASAFTYVLSSKKKGLIIFMAVILAVVCSFFVASIKTPSMFNFLLERGEEDTRTGVEDYLYADLNSTEWIIGKGINGSYYCPVVEDVNDAAGSGQRDAIETGYLQIILKGGLLSLGLLLIILLPAVYKGFFQSKNILSKAAAIWIFLWILYLYPVIGVNFSAHYILVWICVGICYSKQITSLPDATIKEYLERLK